ncbi:MAG: hypothetical protein QXD88_00865 [Candidatus Anstonellales archaeon]
MKYLKIPIKPIYPDASRINSIEDISNLLVDILGLGRSKVVRYIIRRLIEAKLSRTHVTIDQLYIESRLNRKSLYYHMKRLQRLGIVNRENKAYFLGETVDQPLKSFLENLYKSKLDRMIETISQVLAIASNRFG